VAVFLAEQRLDTCPNDVLSLDQIAAIQLYTQPGIFYDYFNGRARDPDRTLLVPLLPYLRLLLTALYRLPPVAVGGVVGWCTVAANLQWRCPENQWRGWRAWRSCGTWC
jgi:hypothetical protein